MMKNIIKLNKMSINVNKKYSNFKVDLIFLLFFVVIVLTSNIPVALTKNITDTDNNSNVSVKASTCEKTKKYDGNFDYLENINYIDIIDNFSDLYENDSVEIQNCVNNTNTKYKSIKYNNKNRTKYNNTKEKLEMLINSIDYTDALIFDERFMPILY